MGFLSKNPQNLDPEIDSKIFDVPLGARKGYLWTPSGYTLGFVPLGINHQTTSNNPQGIVNWGQGWVLVFYFGGPKNSPNFWDPQKKTIFGVRKFCRKRLTPPREMDRDTSLCHRYPGVFFPWGGVLCGRGMVSLDCLGHKLPKLVGQRPKICLFGVGFTPQNIPEG